jgi:hypothetical protein
MRVARPALSLASPEFLAGIADQLHAAGIQYAIVKHDSIPLIDYFLARLSLQGVSDQAAFGFDRKHGGIRSVDIERGLCHSPSCFRLTSYWAFEGCGYRKSKRTCSEPARLADCPLPRHNLRKGGLNIGAYSLVLFLRDICRGDIIAWIDSRLAAADPGEGAADRAEQMRDSLITPLTCISNAGAKLWNMLLADLLLAGDPNRERWMAVGARMIAVDSLMHAFLDRTGNLRRFHAEHAYGEGCYRPNGCADIITALAEQIDAREFNPGFPSVFPRFVQHAIWQFCATGERNICNGVRVDDRERCRQATCPVFPVCDRVALGRLGLAESRRLMGGEGGAPAERVQYQSDEGDRVM